MEPPSSDAEALRDQETAQVRAAHSLLVAADEFCDLECGQQPVRQSTASVRGVGSASRDFGSMRRVGVRRLAHQVPPHSCGIERSVRRRIQMGTNRAGECGDGDHRLEPTTRAAGSMDGVGAGPDARAPMSHQNGRRSMRCAKRGASNPSTMALRATGRNNEVAC